jgi:hypothetical protein
LPYIIPLDPEVPYSTLLAGPPAALSFDGIFVVHPLSPSTELDNQP